MWSYVQYIVWLPSLGSGDRARRRPAQEFRTDEHVDHSAASGRLESPKTRGLRGSQRQARHFEKFSTYPMDAGVDVRRASAGARLEAPKTRGVRGSQRQARHFEKFSTYPMDEGVEVRMAIQSVWA